MLKPHILTTPCIGRCSTTFGDEICRGCRRYSNEIIHWNGSSDAEKATVWIRINHQLDQIILPLIPHADFEKVLSFLNEKKIALPEKNSLGRVYYLALKFCYKFSSYTVESGLNINSADLKAIWLAIEKETYQIATSDFKKHQTVDVA